MRLAADYVRRWLVALASRPGESLRSLPDAGRFYSRWRAALEDGRSPVADERPWITFGAAGFLDRVLTPGSLVFEYGSGGSTLFFARRARRVVTVEHDAEWLATVRAALLDAGTAATVELQLVPPESAGPGDPGDPGAYVSSSEAFRGRGFRAYASAIDPHPEATFDLVSIDGRSRPSCVAHALRKVKAGGYLMLDDSERPHYARATRLLDRWDRRDFYGPAPYLRMFFRTTFWRRWRPPDRTRAATSACNEMPRTPASVTRATLKTPPAARDRS